MFRMTKRKILTNLEKSDLSNCDILSIDKGVSIEDINQIEINNDLTFNQEITEIDQAYNLDENDQDD